MADIYSTSKAIWHTDKIKSLQEGKMISPTLLQVDLMAYCNDNCVFCSYRKENGYNNKMLKLIDAIPGKEYDGNKPIGKPVKEGQLPDEFAVSLPKMMKEAGIPAIELTGGGEPTLWNKFDELVKNLKENDIEIGLVTNGSNLPNERIKLLAESCSWIRFSMDSADQKVHKEIHRTPNFDFERRIQNLTKLSRAERHYNKLIIGISFIITPQNYEYIEETIIFYKSIGVNNIRFSWMYDRTGTAGLNENTIKLLKNDLERFKKKYDLPSFKVYFESGRIDSYSEANTDFNTCYMQNFVWAIGADCKVYPCCIIKYWPEKALADLREKSLKQIVEDVNVHAKMNNLQVMSCPPCWLRTRNKVIATAVEKPIHANFV